jgi:hypothetical protein
VVELATHLLRRRVTTVTAVRRRTDERPAEREGGTEKDIVEGLAVRGSSGRKKPPCEVLDVTWLGGLGRNRPWSQRV